MARLQVLMKVKSWVVVLLFAVMAGVSVSISAHAEDPVCDDLLASQARRTLRDLRAEEHFIQPLQEKWSLSDLAVQRLRESLLSGDHFGMRAKIVHYLIQNPAFLRSVESALQATNSSQVFLPIALESGKIRYEELARVYREFTPITTALASLFGFVPAAVVSAVHVVMKGTRENQLLTRAQVWLGTANTAHRWVTGSTILGGASKRLKAGIQDQMNLLPESLRQAVDVAAQRASQALGMAFETAQNMFKQGRQMSENMYAEAILHARNLKAEIELCAMFAKVAKAWSDGGIPVTRVERVKGQRPVLEMEDAYLASSSDLSRFVPYTFSLPHDRNTTPSPLTVVVTGEHGSGKTSLLESVAWADTLDRIGSYVPAKSFRISSSTVLLTSLLGGVGRGSNESLSQAQIRELKEIIALAKSNGPVLVLVDEVGSGLEPTERRNLVREFRTKMAEARVDGLLILATNSNDVAEDLHSGGALPIETVFSADSAPSKPLNMGSVFKFGEEPPRPLLE